MIDGIFVAIRAALFYPLMVSLYSGVPSRTLIALMILFFIAGELTGFRLRKLERKKVTTKEVVNWLVKPTDDPGPP